MRVQAMFHGGPFDGSLVTIYAADEVATELRLADLSGEFVTDEKAQAHLYRVEGHEDQANTRTVFASYSYVAPVVSRLGLVDVWIT